MTEKNMVQAIHDTLFDEMKRDDRVLVLGEDVGARGGVFRATMGFLDEFGQDRVLDTPLDECLIAGISIGMAIDGLRPVAEMQFADFIFPGFNQIVQEAARIRYRSNGDFSVPMVIRAPYGGGVHGALYHSQSVEAFFAHVPGLKVVAPVTPHDAKGMLLQAIDDPDPVIFLEHKKTYRSIKGEVPDERYTIEFGKAEVRRQGADVTCVSYGLMMHYCLEAAERLTSEGVDVEVIDLRSIYPLDMETVLESVGKTGKAMIVYEDNKFLGLGAEVAAQIAENALFELDGPIVRIGGPHVPAMPYSPTLEHWFLPDADRIEQEMRKLAEF
ncbi:MAG: alpha-ketoacid dehydrogenase subunit beta [Actinomycetota bacterium]|jgi:2-oxoisovalerate dehydrogenase E1 component beta subunit|nr:alpha-ketoacid dehydrogenase subunit beta [Actinomycetota bacterium]HEX3327955.1 alpha-ketoacid dehydrogenase subunit beta [Actinomycetota bacterium]